MSTGYDALQNKGYPITSNYLSDIRLQRLKDLAEQASDTFPPPFVDKPQKENIFEENDTSDDARRIADIVLKYGRNANKNRDIKLLESGHPTLQELETGIGGIDGFFTLFGCHYVGMFSNPRMQVLFDTRSKEDAKHSAMDHGKRTASAFLDLWYGTRYFASLGRGPSPSIAVLSTHRKAKNCPMRPLSQQIELPEGAGDKANRRFTVNQRDSWVGHLMLAAEQCGASKELQNKLGYWVATKVSVYGPFYNDETKELDWMEHNVETVHS